jgi:hypothetical protein
MTGCEACRAGHPGNLERMIGSRAAVPARVLLIGMRVPPNYGPVYAQAFDGVYAGLASAPGRARAVPAGRHRARRGAVPGRRHAPKRRGAAAAARHGLAAACDRCYKLAVPAIAASVDASVQRTGQPVRKVWLRSYPRGVPAEINPDEYRSLPHLLGEAIATAPRPAGLHVHGPTRSDSASSIGSSEHFRRYLQQVARLRKGDRVAIMLPNVLQYPVALLAAFKAGLTVVNTNPLYTPRELHTSSTTPARARS